MHPKKISPDWAGLPVVCIGGGPSLTRDDVDYVQGKAKVIAINNGYQIAPWADLLYACDLKWWKWHNGCPGFSGEKWTMDEQASLKFNLNYIEGIPGRGLSDKPDVIHHGSNSGFQALNLAYLLGASKIILLGYDMKISDDNRSHWFGEHPDKIRSNYQPWLEHFNIVARHGKANIINCSRDTALTCFPQSTIREIL